jgi:hypothetical protein
MSIGPHLRPAGTGNVAASGRAGQRTGQQPAFLLPSTLKPDGRLRIERCVVDNKHVCNSRSHSQHQGSQLSIRWSEMRDEEKLMLLDKADSTDMLVAALKRDLNSPRELSTRLAKLRALRAVPVTSDQKHGEDE